MISRSVWTGILLAALSVSNAGAGSAPVCPAHGKDLPVNNQEVLEWKQSTCNQHLERAHVSGEVVKIYPSRNGHEHFSIQIGSHSQETLEVVYNTQFGTIPNPQPGMKVEACGDYITSTSPTGRYQASPDGAIIHWIHKNPSGHGHDSGYLMIDGKLFGQGSGKGGSFQQDPISNERQIRRNENSSRSNLGCR